MCLYITCYLNRFFFDHDTARSFTLLPSFERWIINKWFMHALSLSWNVNKYWLCDDPRKFGESPPILIIYKEF